MVATYVSIASEYQDQADGPLVLTAYQLGFSVALTVVRERFPHSSGPHLWDRIVFGGWLWESRLISGLISWRCREHMLTYWSVVP